MLAPFAIAIAAAVVGQTSDVTYVNTLNSGFTYPARLAPEPGGGILVTDPSTNSVHQFSAAGALLNSYGVAQGPIGIAVHSDGRVFLARGDGLVGVYTSAFAVIGTVDPDPLELVEPNDLFYDPVAAELYVVDAGADRVLVFHEVAGVWELDRAWGVSGGGLGQMETPQAITVDPVSGNVIMTDTDNSRMQVFDRLGTLLFRFGYRILFTAGGEVGWMPRSEGVAVDSCGNIYVTDAVMGTVRVFDALGHELDADHLPLVGYGSGAGQLRVPGDILIDATDRMYIANTNNGSVEVFDVDCTAGAQVATLHPAAPAPIGRDPAGKRGTSAMEAAQRRYEASRGAFPDDPSDILRAIYAGEYCEAYDLNRDGTMDRRDVEIAIEHFGAGTVEDFVKWAGVDTQTAGTHDVLNEPHILNIANRCGRCHGVDGTPGGDLLRAAGQENLCLSCHSVGKIAGAAWVGPGSDENSHPWDEDADEGVSDGPLPGSEMAMHLDNGKIRCGTCHNPHENRPVGSCISGTCAGGPFHGSVCKSDPDCASKVRYMREEIYGAADHLASQGGTPTVYARKRMTVMDATMCGECHVDIVAEWSIVGHADTSADPWSHYDWSVGNNWLCTGPGTPYAYCTGEKAGTAASASAAVCTGAGTPLACCTGPGTGTCTLAAAMCTGPGVPEPCCTGPGTGACSSRESCRQCHSGNGFIDYSRDYPDGTVLTSTHRGSLRVIDCLVCHSTHGTSQDAKLLRIYDTVRLPTGQVFTGVGAGATCMACHNGRSVPPTNPSSVSSPHYLNGAAMLEGVNAVTTFPNGAGAVVYTLSNSNHTTNAGLNCVTCHMAPGPTSGPEMGMVGGHTFRLKNHETGYENVGSGCNTSGCHTGLTTINRTANGDYDGDTVIEGVQDETRGLLALLKDALYAAGASRLLLNAETGLPTTEDDPEAEPANPYWTLRKCSGGTRDTLACNGTGAGTAPFNCPGGACNAVVPTGDRTATVVNAIFNWEFVDNSGDLGVKNTGYAIGLLQIAYKGVTGNPVPDAAYRYSPAP